MPKANHDTTLDPAAGVLMVGLEGQSLSAEESSFLQKVKPAGVILFGRNIDQDHFGKLKQLTESIQKFSGAHSMHARAHEDKRGATSHKPYPPLLIAIDQEGGRVARLKGNFPNLGPAAKLAQGQWDAPSLATIQNYGYQVGTQLLKLGINVNFAPVVDLATEPRNIAIGDRCFGETPTSVVARAGAFLRGLTEASVLGCLKHFPGQGHAVVDTHLGTAVVDLPRKTLEERELVPFAELHNQSPMVMVAHSIYPVWSPKEASRSPEIITDLLRNLLGFSGVVVTDDMMMGAIPQSDSAWAQAIIDSIAAGADLVLVCKGLDRAQLAYQTLTAEAQKNPNFRARLFDAATRVLGMRMRLDTHGGAHET